MGIAAVVCALIVTAGAEAPFGQAETEGMFKGPINRYVEVQYDFLAPASPPPAAASADIPAAASPAEAVPGVPPPPEAPVQPIQIARGPAQAGGRSFSSLCLHPLGVQQAAVSFPAVMIRPVLAERARTFLVFRVALADPMVAPEDMPQPGPLTLTVTFGDSVVHTEEIAERKWIYRAVDLTGLSGKMETVTFSASTLNSEEKDSVLCLGDPLLIEEQGAYYQRQGGRSLSFGFSLTGFPRNTAGLAFTQVQCDAPASIEVSVGDATENYSIPAGTHWLPLAFSKPGRFAFKATSSSVKFLSLDVAPFTPLPHFVPPPSSPEVPSAP